MKWKKLSDEIRDALKTEKASEFFESILPEVRSNIKDGQNQIRRTLGLLLLLMAIFELLVRGVVIEASFGPVKLNDLTVLLISIPVLIAYIYHSIISNIVSVTLMKGLHNSVINLQFPRNATKSFRSLLLPPSTFNLLNIGDDFMETGSARGGIFFYALLTFTLIIFGFVIFFPIAFEIYAYSYCFKNFGFHSVLVWISLAISILLFVKSFLNFKILQELNPDATISL